MFAGFKALIHCGFLLSFCVLKTRLQGLEDDDGIKRKKNIFDRDKEEQK